MGMETIFVIAALIVLSAVLGVYMALGANKEEKNRAHK
jgi:hypothetical protein